jgi:Cell division protein CrgA
VPKSHVRKKAVYTPPPSRSPKRAVSPPWLAPTMIVTFVLGLAWIALYYVTQADMPVMRSLGGWNLVIGFALIVSGVILATRWQ